MYSVGIKALAENRIKQLSLWKKQKCFQ